VPTGGPPGAPYGSPANSGVGGVGPGVATASPQAPAVTGNLTSGTTAPGNPGSQQASPGTAPSGGALPAQAAMQRKQQAAGVGLPPAQAQAQTALVEQQANQLIQKSQSEIGQIPPGSLPPK
jgi:hypothetical protein